MTDEYDEVDAVVRIPKGERLADSRKTEGWSRGFTPKSSDKGPEHVEIRLKDQSELVDEPEAIYVPPDVEIRQLTPAQQVAADIVRQVIEDLVETAKPLVAHWWHTQALPAIAAKRQNFVLNQQARKAQKMALRAESATNSLGVETAVEAESPAQDVASVPDNPKVTVTSEEFRQLFMTWLAREDAQQALWSLIVNANVEDGDAAMLAWQQELKELSPEQRNERVTEFFGANPSILEDFARQLMGGMALGLGEATLRCDPV